MIYPSSDGARFLESFGTKDATIYNWLKQERIDRGEVAGLSTEEALDLAAASNSPTLSRGRKGSVWLTPL